MPFSQPHVGLLPRVAPGQSQLYSSLGANGKGHGGDTAVLQGLARHELDTIEG